MLDSIGRISTSAINKLRIKSALNPILWLCAITMPIFLSMAVFFSNAGLYIALYIVLSFMGFLLLVSCGVFVYFAICKPEKLQSEDYQLRHESIQWMQLKGGSVDFVPTSIEQIINPALHQIDSKEDVE